MACARGAGPAPADHVLITQSRVNIACPSDKLRLLSQVLRDLEGEKGLERFRELYETVLQAVRRAHGTYLLAYSLRLADLIFELQTDSMPADNERRLAAKCKQLNEDLVGAGARVTAALRLSEEDQTTIATLRKELEKTWRQIGASHDKVPTFSQDHRISCITLLSSCP